MNHKECNPALTDDYINRILTYLQGWVLKDESVDDIQMEYASSVLERQHMDDMMTNIHQVTESELELFFEKAKNEVKSYIWFDYIPAIAPVHEAICKWTAGLVWKKYNVKEVELMDRTNQLGYGDQLIVQAKYILKPYVRTISRSLI